MAAACHVFACQGHLVYSFARRIWYTSTIHGKMVIFTWGPRRDRAAGWPCLGIVDNGRGQDRMKDSVAVVMAAGKGTRIESDLPKVLLEVCNRPMIDYVLDSLTSGGIERILVVVGYRGELVKECLANRTNVTFVEQPEQLGTGHAVMVCRDELVGLDGPVVVVTGDSPMLQKDSIAKLLAEFERSKPACLLGTANNPEPRGLGRIVRDREDRFVAIVEEKDATDEQRRITEVNMSTYVFNCRDLLAALEEIKPNNVQGEYYITDCPGVLKAAGKDVRALPVLKPVEALSVNTLEQLSLVEAAMKAGHSQSP